MAAKKFMIMHCLQREIKLAIFSLELWQELLKHCLLLHLKRLLKLKLFMTDSKKFHNIEGFSMEWVKFDKKKVG